MGINKDIFFEGPPMLSKFNDANSPTDIPVQTVDEGSEYVWRYPGIRMSGPNPIPGRVFFSNGSDFRVHTPWDNLTP